MKKGNLKKIYNLKTDATLRVGDLQKVLGLLLDHLKLRVTVIETRTRFGIRTEFLIEQKPRKAAYL